MPSKPQPTQNPLPSTTFPAKIGLDLRDSLAGLARGIHVPIIRARRGVIKGFRTSINPLLRSELASFTKYAVNSYLSEGDDRQDVSVDTSSGGGMSRVDYSFYKSQAQLAGRSLEAFISGQRIR